jgi:crossover junction endodeoxyribonuclease RuvC
MVQPDRIILGIDPGTNMMGFGVLNAAGKVPGYIDMGVLDIRKEGDHYMKLSAIFKTTIKLIENYDPVELASKHHFTGRMCNPCSNWDGHRVQPFQQLYLRIYPCLNMRPER